jgi:alpha/beta hydrolase family protein
MLKTVAAGAFVLGLFTADASARITEIRLVEQELFAGGATFGSAGPYVRLRGTAWGELDPKSPQNAVIADIDKAPLNARGMVAYETDFFILRPIDPARGNGVLLYEVNNRGLKFLLPWLDEAKTTTGSFINDPKAAGDAGLGFTLGRGYAIVWSGWDPAPAPVAGSLATRVPVALESGKPMVRRIRQELQIGTRGPADVAVARLAYPAASTDKARARLTVRAREADARSDVPPEGWEFADAQSIRLLPQGSKFAPIRIYELWYEATEPKIVGIGYAATRDLVSFLRNERDDGAGNLNPMNATAEDARPAVRHAIAFGISQSGRYLRHYLDLGMNRDERGKRVFDGVLAHIAGAGKVFANHTFAMPGRTATQHEDRYYPENWFPFSAAAASDPFSGKTAALFKGDGSDPLWMETNTSTEYWQKGASLVHIDPAARQDLALPSSARVYLIAGTQHGGRANLTPAPGACANARNPHNPVPALRALIVALEEWVTRGTAPPASRVPSIAQGTAIAARDVRLPAVNGFTHAPGDNPIGAPVDWIDPPGSGEKVYLAASGPQVYVTRVAAVDADGNETAGIRLPDIAVPLATYTGWNVYKALPSELCDRDGSYIPFARTKAERQVAGDPRPSLEERYASRADYVAKVKAAAEALVAERLLLPADAERYVKAAEASDRF